MRKRRAELEANLPEVLKMIERNGEKAMEEAEKMMKKVRSAVGLR